MFNKAASSIEVEHTQVLDWWDHMFNKAASSIEVEHTQVRRYLSGITCSTRQPAVPLEVVEHVITQECTSILLDVEHVGSHVQQGSQQYRGRTHSGTASCLVEHGSHHTCCSTSILQLPC